MSGGAPRVRLVQPSDSWCAIVNGAAAGDEIVFAPGSYTSPCWITAVGAPAAPVVIRSQHEDDASLRATFAYPGSTANVIELRDVAHVVLRGFAFAPTQAGVDAIRIVRGHDVVIEANAFDGIGGISVSANMDDAQRITVRGNTFRDLKSTGLYFGCHDGIACHASELVIESNLIDGVIPADPSEVGYGLEVKLNSYGTVRDNTIYRTKGPGLMIYGSNQNDPPTSVEGNYVEGSLTEGGIVVGGGPAIVRNNVLVANAYGGISVQNYGGRDLQRNVWIVHNTMLDNDDAAINIEGWIAGGGNVVAFNALAPRPGTPALRPSSPVGTVTGNVVCDPARCFAQASTAPYDLLPAVGGPLVDAAGSGPEVWRPSDDFMGVPRGPAADVGALERTSTAATVLLGGGAARPPRSGPSLSPSLWLASNKTSFHPGEALAVAVTAANPGAAQLVTVYFGALLPPESGPSSGCPLGDPVAFVADGSTRVVLTCLSASPQGFPPFAREVTLPAGLPATTFPLISSAWPDGAPPGVYTFFVAFTRPGGLTDGRLDAGDVLALGIASLVLAP